jgi:hypothetical protein
MNDLRREMAIQAEVELELNSLIRGMSTLVDKTQIADGGMEKAQMKNLLGTALDTESVEVVLNYIRYQMGRDTRELNWRYQRFGDELVRALNGLRADAERIVIGAHRDLGLGDPSQRQIDAAWLHLVRHYLGQLNRYFYYRKEAQRWPKETS